MSTNVTETQPSALPQMTIVKDPRNPKALAFNERGRRQWNYGLFGCFDDFATCVVAYLVPCATYAQTRSRFNHLTLYGTRNPGGGEIANSDFALFAIAQICTGCGCLLEMSQRRSIRERYRIEGGPWSDLCISCCCLSCAMTQESREIGAEETEGLGL
ncbi:PLAC8-domain-containing protein [Sistotremastrum niveocremeum HHB9708]|uniref:PLAC8-domain-containing protein n=1 Tax=Sistotremastrum niveocremeum HHB9708 TaxID=1314777 RepID=A0A164PJP0_9AGAM|nr:PLAC8-domain-containing protein [Sistotremastrum niveocremeum HHB9708]